MTLRNDAALDFLLNRRSRPAKTLTGPAPSKDELTVILEAGTRVPDHGKLEPWRLKVLEKPALEKIAVYAKRKGQPCVPFSSSVAFDSFLN